MRKFYIKYQIVKYGTLINETTTILNYSIKHALLEFEVKMILLKTQFILNSISEII